jgi:hypothetical protein
MTPEQLKAIRERAEAATAGPWESTTPAAYEGAPDAAWLKAPRGTDFYTDYDGGIRQADAAFIAHARADVPALLALVEQLQERVKELTKVAAYHDWVVNDLRKPEPYSAKEIDAIARRALTPAGGASDE